MSQMDEIDSRICFLIDWLVAAVQMLHEQNISPGLVSMVVDRLEGYSQPEDALGLKMLTASLGLRVHWAWEEGRLDEALALFRRLASFVKPDDSCYYIEIAGVIRVLLRKGEQAAAFQQMGRSALTAMDTEELPDWVAFDMLALARYGDLKESVKTTVFLDALDKYERRSLADKNLGLADVWRHDPHRALSLLLEHSPHPPPRQGPDPGPQDEGRPETPG